LALKLLQAVQARHPSIVLHINENFGTTLCDVVRSGVMDMAVLYGEESAVQGLSFDPLLTEDLCVVGPAEMNAPGDLMLSDLCNVDLVLPCTNNRLRRCVDGAFASINVVPRVVAEMESSSTLAAAIASGLGATILPVSVARSVAATASVNVRRLVSPTIEVPLVLCVSDHLALSEPAQVVRAILLELVEGLHLEHGLHLETEVSW
jgi:LysR family nitrogen assimilation transcriptional regulator